MVNRRISLQTEWRLTVFQSLATVSSWLHAERLSQQDTAAKLLKFNQLRFYLNENLSVDHLVLSVDRVSLLKAPLSQGVSCKDSS